MSRIHLTRVFERWRRKTGVLDDVLRGAVEEMRRGLVDADLGGGLLKKRIPLPGRGKRGGARVLLASRRGERWIFLRGFAKNERENLTPDEQAALRMLAGRLLELPEAALDRAVAEGEFILL